MRWQILGVSFASVLLSFGSDRMLATELPTAEIAEQLSANTVTVRAMADVPAEEIGGGPAGAGQAARTFTSNGTTVETQAENGLASRLVVVGPDGQPRAVVASQNLVHALNRIPEVSVGSGVALEEGLIVTMLASPLPSKVRVTLPDGSQADAEPRVFDSYTGLCLLQVADARLPGLPVSGEIPRVGSAVMTAAASGTERALVSQGVLSGVDRLADAKLPPLLQSDVRTAETSHGAGLVDDEGRLIGILVTTEIGEERTGWCYALPTSHVTRLTKAVVPGELVMLEHQRPTIGLKLSTDPQGAGVRVLEAFDGLPAREAGIEDGDLLTTIEDQPVRHAHQVQTQVLKRAPGDHLSVGYERAGEKRQADVTLGAAGMSQQMQNQVLDQAAPRAQSPDESAQRSRFGPQLKVQRIAPNQLEIRNSARGLNTTVLQNQNAPEGTPPASDGEVGQRLRNLQALVETLQAELARRAQAESESAERLNSLNAEVERLRELLDAGPQKPE
ncbi:MAG: serine protease [Pirellulales bacterium]|nr:serine protease [Pirellulales bacterium]